MLIFKNLTLAGSGEKNHFTSRMCSYIYPHLGGSVAKASKSPQRPSHNSGMRHTGYCSVNGAREPQPQH